MAYEYYEINKLYNYLVIISVLCLAWGSRLASSIHVLQPLLGKVHQQQTLTVGLPGHLLIHHESTINISSTLTATIKHHLFPFTSVLVINHSLIASI